MALCYLRATNINLVLLGDELKLFIILYLLPLYFFTYFSHVNNQTELDIWCSKILQNEQSVSIEPLGLALLEVCSSSEHLEILNKILLID